MTLGSFAPKTLETKEKLDKPNFIKIKIFCTSKNTIKQVKKTIHILGENVCKSIRLIRDLQLESIKNTQFSNKRDK